MALVGLILALFLAALAIWIRLQAKGAERDFPQAGRFIDVDGVRLHYIEAGSGPAALLLHGNGVQSTDFVGCGLMEELASRYRVIAFDRPGFGYSQRPRGKIWTPKRQACLLAKACLALGVADPIVLGHSFGTLVALEMAFDDSISVRGLILVSGYYFPTTRPDVWLVAPQAIPILGDILRYTISPIMGWMMMPVILRKTFAPQPVARAFVQETPPVLMVRPWQIKAAAEDSACMVPAANQLSRRYDRIRLPVEIFAGTADRIVHRQQSRQSARLHELLPCSELHILPGEGHMLHYDLGASLAGAMDRIAASEGVLSAIPKAFGPAAVSPRHPPGRPAPV
jgi:pimeloyl-ACP methyl ester carboxylesterase